MKVLIDIPKEFEEDLKDNFKDFFNRMIADITYSLNDEELMCCGNYERETAEMFLSAFEKATVIPNGATNGDILKMMFPSDANELNMSKLHLMYDGLDYIHEFRKDWWNAPYKKEVEE